MKSILFCRVSSKEQEESGYSLPAQEKLLRNYSENKSLKINKIFSISESASGHKQRQVFELMMAYVKSQDIKVIVCEKVDRLTRNLRDAVDINDWMDGNSERQVHFVKENVILSKDSRSNEKFIWNIKVSVAQYYIDNLSEEVRKGQKEKIAQGWLPTKPPLGYVTIGEKGHKTHLLNKEKSPLVKKMFDLYSTGNYSLKNLVEIMYREGLRTDFGNKLVKSRLHNLLTDPFYYGKIRWNNQVYEGKHEPLIDKETFDQVQMILKRKTTPKYHKHQFTFRGLIKCKECGGLITWETKKGHIYGHCNHYRNCSQDVWANENQVEEQLLDKLDIIKIENPRLAEWILKALKESHQDEIQFHSSTLAELQQKETQLRQRLDKLYDDKLDGKITETFYNQKFKQYSQELDEFSDSIKKHDQASLKYFQMGINIFQLSQKAKEIYLKANAEEKRQLLNLVFQDLTLDKGNLSYSFTEPFKVLAEAVKFTNSPKITKMEVKEGNIFGQSQYPVLAMQNDNFESYRSILLPRP